MSILSLSGHRTGIHRTLLSYLEDRFDIVDVIYVPEIDGDPANFYRFFSQFTTREFKHTERVLISYCDTDYYADINAVPNNLYNIIKSIAYTNVSTDHLLMLTMSFDVEPTVDRLCQGFNIGAIPTISTRLWHDFPSLIQDDVKIKDQKTHLFSAAIGVPRVHRRLFLASVYDKNLLPFGVINYRPGSTKPPTLQHRPMKATKLPDDLVLRTTVPFSRINDELSLTQKGIALDIKHQHDLKKEIISISELCAPNDPTQGHSWCSQYLQDSLVHVVLETVGQYPHVWFSEKTWRAINSRAPFMIVGARGSIRKLQSLGFKTFGSFWDESYDDCPTIFDRVDKITDNLSKLSTQDWNQIFREMLPILEHNLQVLTQIQPKELERIKNWLDNH